MTPTRYREILPYLGLTQSTAGEFVGVHRVTGRRWAETGPPPPVGLLLELMVACRFTADKVQQLTGERK